MASQFLTTKISYESVQPSFILVFRLINGSIRLDLALFGLIIVWPGSRRLIENFSLLWFISATHDMTIKIIIPLLIN